MSVAASGQLPGGSGVVRATGRDDPAMQRWVADVIAHVVDLSGSYPDAACLAGMTDLLARATGVFLYHVLYGGQVA